MGGRRRGVSFFQISENYCDHLGLGDEGDDSELAAAFTNEGVGLADPSDQICPPLLVFGGLMIWLGRRRVT